MSTSDVTELDNFEATNESQSEKWSLIDFHTLVDSANKFGLLKELQDHIMTGDSKNSRFGRFLNHYMFERENKVETPNQEPVLPTTRQSTETLSYATVTQIPGAPVMERVRRPSLPAVTAFTGTVVKGNDEEEHRMCELKVPMSCIFETFTDKINFCKLIAEETSIWHVYIEDPQFNETIIRLIDDRADKRLIKAANKLMENDFFMFKKLWNNN
jgi:hypothetical protein